MSSRDIYKECERLYRQVNWNDRKSIHEYNEKVRELHRQREAEAEERRNESGTGR